MGKRGPKPKRKVKIKWSSNFAYAIGLLATDGCVSSDRIHIDFTSKDIGQVLNFKKALALNNRITRKSRGKEEVKKYHHVQFGDVVFVKFLESIGITPAKSKTISQVKVPNKYFFDFLRGCFDGDGSFYSYRDTRWRSSFMYYLSFCSASSLFMRWLRDKANQLIGVNGHITSSKGRDYWQLKYAKREGFKIIKKMYHSKGNLFLFRKKLKINRALAMIDGERLKYARVEKLADSHP